MLADMLTDMEAKADASAIDPLLLLKFSEELEQLWFILDGDSRAIVFNVDHDELVGELFLELAADLNMATLLGELERVCEQVESDLLHALGVGCHFKLTVGTGVADGLKFNAYAFRLRLEFLSLHNLHQRLVDVHMLDVFLNGARFQLG